MSNDSITEGSQFAAATKSIALDQGNSGDMVSVEFFKGGTIIMNGSQHLYFTTIKMVMDIDACTKGSFACTRENDQAWWRGVFDDVMHSCRKLIEHLDGKDVEWWPIKNEPKNVFVETNMEVGHTSFPRCCGM